MSTAPSHVRFAWSRRKAALIALALIGFGCQKYAPAPSNPRSLVKSASAKLVIDGPKGAVPIGSPVEVAAVLTNLSSQTAISPNHPPLEFSRAVFRRVDESERPIGTNPDYRGGYAGDTIAFFMNPGRSSKWSISLSDRFAMRSPGQYVFTPFVTVRADQSFWIVEASTITITVIPR